MEWNLDACGLVAIKKLHPGAVSVNEVFLYVGDTENEKITSGWLPWSECRRDAFRSTLEEMNAWRGANGCVALIECVTQSDGAGVDRVGEIGADLSADGRRPIWRRHRSSHARIARRRAGLSVAQPRFAVKGRSPPSGGLGSNADVEPAKGAASAVVGRYRAPWPSAALRRRGRSPSVCRSRRTPGPIGAQVQTAERLQRLLNTVDSF